MITSEIVNITPEYARMLLSKNGMNRPLNKGHVLNLANAMSRGDWQVNGESIKIAQCGTLLDGQHRLSAIVKTGSPCDIVVIKGLPLESFHTINTGAKTRGAADVLAITGEKNSSVLAAAARLLKCWEDNKTCPKFQGYHVTVAEIEDIIDRHQKLRTYSSYKSDGLKKMINPSLICFLAYVFHMVNPIKAAQFFDQLETGLGMEKGSPVLILRDRLLLNSSQRPKLNREVVCALVIKSFNAFAENKSIGSLRFSSNEKFPLIVGV